MNKQLDLLQYAETINAKYPEVSKELVMKIIENAPRKIDTTEYELAFLSEQKLGLSRKYFSNAYRNNVDIKANLVKEGSFIYVKLDCEIKKLLDERYICCKITHDEVDLYDHTISLTKNTLLGFYK